MKPWEQYQEKAPASKPWEKYAAPAETETPGDRLAAFKEQQVATAPEEGSWYSPITEPVSTLATSVAAMPLSGVAGTLQSINPFADVGAGAEAVEKTQDALIDTPDTMKGQAALETLGGGIQNVVDVVNYPLSGLMGLAELMTGQGLEQAANTVNRVQDEGLGVTAGDRVLEETDSPLLATAARVLPDAALELTALKGSGAVAKAGGKSVAKTAARKADDWARKQDDLLKQADEIRKTVDENDLPKVADAIKSGDANELAAIIKPDENFYRAMDELDISTEPVASFASQNPQYIDVEMALASVPGSEIAAQADNFVTAVSKKADDLIADYGGSVDKADLSDTFRTESMNTIDNLADRADDLYDRLDEVIPKTMDAEATETLSFILNKADELKGRKELPAEMKRILRELEPKQQAAPKPSKSVITGLTGKAEKPKVEMLLPSHEKLNMVRRRIGQKIKSGDFKDADQGLYKALYSRLRQDQDNIARGLGEVDGQSVAGLSDAANKIVRQRKQLEDNLTSLLGKDLQGSLMPRVGAAVKGLQKGRIHEFDKVINAIPKGKRKAVVMSALNDVFRGTGKGSTSFDATQFSKFMDEVNRNPALKKRLYKNLPKGSGGALENLNVLAQGISKSKAQKVPTGRILALFKGDQGGLVNKLMGSALRGTAKVALAKTTGGMSTVMGGNVVDDFLRQTSDASQMANKMLAQQDFQDMMKIAAREGYVEGRAISKKLAASEKALVRSQRYKKWAEGIDPSAQAQLATVGPLAYFMNEDSE